MSLEGKRIGFVGAGAMAEALAGGLVAAGVEAARLRASDPDRARLAHVEESLGVRGCADNRELAGGSDLIVLAVKPGALAPVLAELAGDPGLRTDRPLWISIAAGVRLGTMQSALGPGARIVRAMPNTPALVRAGATALCGNARASTADLAAARALFEGVGTCWQAPDEALLDAVTGLSGSGPAYAFLFLEALCDAGEDAGLPREAAAQLAAQTLYGAARLVLETGRAPADLRRQVSSPGGTTRAGLERLEAGGFRDAIREAVAAATRRSRELGGGPSA